MSQETRVSPPTRTAKGAAASDPADPRLIFSLDHVTAGRVHPVLHDLSWRVREGELWAVVGPNGSGKSRLLGVLRGQVPILLGALRYGDDPRGRAIADDPVSRVVAVTFGTQSTLLRGAAGYTQSRWHGGQDDAVARGRDVLGAAMDVEECRRIVDALDLAPLLDRRVTELSNGERRKLLLARSAGRRPSLLALDNPFHGLDGGARASVSDAVQRLHREGMMLLVLTSREDEIPGAVTHVLLLDHGRVVTSGPVATVRADERFVRLMRPRPRPSVARSVGVSVGRDGVGEAGAERAPVVELRDVHVQYGKTRVLRGLSWTVRRGERWVVVGRNGAGKSALLSLILADNPQAYANDVSLFGRRRGSGDTIWDIRRRVGSVSPEMHLYEELDPRVLHVIAAAFRDAADVVRPPTREELDAAGEWVDALDLARCRDRRLHELSEGELQMTLLGRALAKRPELLVLDEPCQSLDAGRRERLLELLERELEGTARTLIFVTHDLAEVPSIVDRGLLLRRGRADLEGTAEEVLRAYSLE